MKCPTCEGSPTCAGYPTCAVSICAKCRLPYTMANTRLTSIFHSLKVHTRDVAARPAKVGDETEPHRVIARFKDDRNSRGRRLRRSCRRLAPGGDDDSNLVTNKVMSQFQ